MAALDWLNPLWLPGLVLLPLIWWLHRFGNRPRQQAVSSVIPWRNSVLNTGLATRYSPTDPKWLVRALIVLTLISVLAGLRFHDGGKPTIHAWFDDSLSMHTQENGITRLQLGGKRLLEALENQGVKLVVLHTLSQPGNRTTIDFAGSPEGRQRFNTWLTNIQPAVDRSLPAAPLKKGKHWLITDGTGADLQHWVERAGVQQILSVGEYRENMAIYRLSIRRSLSRPKWADGMVMITNQGTANAERQLQIQVGDHKLHSWSLNLPPHTEIIRRFQLPLASIRSVEAKLLPVVSEIDDPLALDDTLILKPITAVWAVPVRMIGICPKPLLTALQAIPGFRIVGPEQGSRLTIICGGPRPPVDGPTVWFHTPVNPRLSVEAPHWHGPATALSDLALQPRWLQADPAVQGAVGTTLLSTGKITLIALRRSPGPLLQVNLAIDFPVLTRRPEFPVLVAGLLEYVTGEERLDQRQIVERDPLDSRIIPKQLHSTTTAQPSAFSPTGWDPTLWLIGLAIGLLLYDTLREWIRSGIRYSTPAGNSDDQIA
ncbi:MAG: hypothetical protein GY703_20990 [Gammaproteobacteria bacterium]|nr:hypothetical protein [Gammaproteobacteria bacterium]